VNAKMEERIEWYSPAENPTIIIGKQVLPLVPGLLSDNPEELDVQC
jgi:hypothetical protein